MKKIIKVFILALAMSLAFTGCASKKAKESKGPKTYSVDLGSAVSIIKLNEEGETLNVSGLIPEGAALVAGNNIKVRWTFVADADVDCIYVSCGDNSEDAILIKDVKANEAYYRSVVIPLDLDVSGPLMVKVWSSSEVICESTYMVDAK
ncbi:MAG: hypothetical protein J5726_03385 [Treponema sp.]|nr:hypothetical protein [Treponema sp.]